MWKVLATSLNSDELLDVTPPRREIAVANWPVDAEAFLRVRLKVEITPSVDAPSPHDGASTHLPAAYPVERLVFRERVRIVEVVYEKLGRPLVARAGMSLNGLVTLGSPAVAHSSITQLVRTHLLYVIDDRVDRAARLEYDRSQPVFGKLLCGPPTGDSGADNVRVIG